MASDIFLKIEGIDGESTDHAHPNEIEILSYSFGVHQDVSTTTASAGTFTTGRSHVDGLNIQKYLDAASPLLFQACASGEHLAKATLVLNRAGKKDGSKVPFMKYEMTDVLVSNVSTGGSGDGGQVPVESVQLVFGEIKLEYSKTATDGKGSGKIPGSWSLKANQAKS